MRYVRIAKAGDATSAQGNWRLSRRGGSAITVEVMGTLRGNALQRVRGKGTRERGKVKEIRGRAKALRRVV